MGVNKGHAKANTEDLPDVIRSNARNVSGTIAQSVSGIKEKRMQFRSRCSRVLQFACNSFLRRRAKSYTPCFLFQKGVKGSAFANTHFFSFPFFFLLNTFFLPSSLFPYRPPIFIYPPRSVQCSFTLQMFFNMKKHPVGPSPFFFI